MSVKTLRIHGMTCEHCVMAVTKALKAVSGVRSVTVSLDEKKAVLTVDDATYSSEAAKKAVSEEGYTVVSST
jgi:copper chaperone